MFIYRLCTVLLAAASRTKGRIVIYMKHSGSQFSPVLSLAYPSVRLLKIKLITMDDLSATYRANNS